MAGIWWIALGFRQDEQDGPALAWLPPSSRLLRDYGATRRRGKRSGLGGRSGLDGLGMFWSGPNGAMWSFRQDDPPPPSGLWRTKQDEGRGGRKAEKLKM
jgi:hypothetical protein